MLCCARMSRLRLVPCDHRQALNIPGEAVCQPIDGRGHVGRAVLARRSKSLRDECDKRVLRDLAKWIDKRTAIERTVLVGEHVRENMPPAAQEQKRHTAVFLHKGSQSPFEGLGLFQCSNLLELVQDDARALVLAFHVTVETAEHIVDDNSGRHARIDRRRSLHPVTGDLHAWRYPGEETEQTLPDGGGIRPTADTSNDPIRQPLDKVALGRNGIDVDPGCQEVLGLQAFQHFRSQR